MTIKNVRLYLFPYLFAGSLRAHFKYAWTEDYTVKVILITSTTRESQRKYYNVKKNLVNEFFINDKQI